MKKKKKNDGCNVRTWKYPTGTLKKQFDSFKAMGFWILNWFKNCMPVETRNTFEFVILRYFLVDVLP